MRKHSPAKAGKSAGMDLQRLFQRAVDYHKSGQFVEAIAVYERIIALRPSPTVYANLGAALNSLGRHAEALASYDRAIALKPDDAHTHHSRGNSLQGLGRLDEAIASCERAIALEPGNCEFYNKCGLMLRVSGRLADALVIYDRAIEINPEYVTAYNNRGHVLDDLGRLEEALESYDCAIMHKPDYVHAHSNRSGVLNQLYRHDEALAACDRAIAIAPNFTSAYINRGMALFWLGCYAEALSSFDHVLALQPGHAHVQYSKALILLLFGNYSGGFELHEQRWHDTVKVGLKKFTQPQWRGEPIADKTILLHAEQGLGDSIQMLRYLPLLKTKAAHIVLNLPRAIWPLLEAMADEKVTIAQGVQPRPFDLHCPLMSLPLAFGTVVDTIPASIPYLATPAERLTAWRIRLPKFRELRVGLVWSGSANHRNDRNRSIGLHQLGPLLNVKGVSFVSLQREYRNDDPAALAHLPIERIDDGIRNFGDTAAAIEQCDLVISVDTSVAHLAGALGKRLWLLLPYIPDWRWLLERSDSPWYPTARLFRQDRIGDWESVIASVAAELSVFAEQLTNGSHKAVSAKV